jgi:hypothetical protein
MDLFVTTAWAQDAGAAPGGAWMQLLPLVLIFVVFYFLLIRPQTKRAKEHKEMIGKLRLARGGRQGRHEGAEVPGRAVDAQGHDQGRVTRPPGLLSQSSAA